MVTNSMHFKLMIYNSVVYVLEDSTNSASYQTIPQWLVRQVTEEAFLKGC